MGTSVRTRTVSLIAKILRPLMDEDVLTVEEYREIISNLRHLSAKGTLMPAVAPRLLDQRAASERLGISHAAFKKLEYEKRLPFRRRMVGSSVRYRSTDIDQFVLSDDVDGMKSAPESTELPTE